MEHEEVVLESDNKFKLTGWPYSVDPGDEPKDFGRTVDPDEVVEKLIVGFSGSPYERQVSGNHYQHFAIQPHEYIVKNNIPWSAANAIKYLSRYRFKGGKTDLLKAVHYIQLAIAEEYPD